ncbi:MAG: hypothetical protein K9G49_16070 [Taibaiella sp.]|nr:hypothetical protein [Taibaiella sp.]
MGIGTSLYSTVSVSPGFWIKQPDHSGRRRLRCLDDHRLNKGSVRPCGEDGGGVSGTIKERIGISNISYPGVGCKQRIVLAAITF